MPRTREFPPVPTGLIERFPPGPGEGVGGLTVGRAAEEDEPDTVPPGSRRAQQKDVAPKGAAATLAAPDPTDLDAKKEREQRSLVVAFDARRSLLDRLLERGTGAVAEAEAQRTKAVEQVVKPALQTAREAAAEPLPDLPKTERTPPVPSLKVRPFGDTADARQTLPAVINGLALLAQLVTGMVNRTPVQALGALTGAMQGWAEGDTRRAERDWREYLGHVEQIREDNAQAIRLWEAAVQKHGANQERAKVMLTTSLAEEGLADKAVAAARMSLQDTLGVFDRERQMADTLFSQTKQLEQLYATEQLKMFTAVQTAEKTKAQIENLREQTKMSAFMMQMLNGAKEGEGGVNKVMENWGRQIYNGATPGELGIPRIGKMAVLGLAAQRKATEIAEKEGTPAEQMMLTRRLQDANKAALKDRVKDLAEYEGYVRTFEQTLTATRGLWKKIADTSGVPAIDRYAIMARARLGDSDARNLLAQMETLSLDAQRVLSRAKGQGAEASKEHARQIFDPGMSAENFLSLTENVFTPDALRGISGIQETIDRLKQEIAHPYGTTPAAQTPASPTERIRVRRKSDGKPGTIEAKDLTDAYERVP